MWSGEPYVSTPVIDFLLAVCFLAITGYCLLVLWPKLRWSLHTRRHPDGLRPQYRADQPRFDLRDLFRRH